MSALSTLLAPTGGFDGRRVGTTSPSGSEQVNLFFRVDPSTAELYRALDEWAISFVAESSEKYLKKAMTREEVQRIYTPVLAESEEYGPRIRSKMWLSGSRTTKLRSAEKTLLDEWPEDWKPFEFRANQELQGFWFHSGKWGYGLQLRSPSSVRPAAGVLSQSAPSATTRAHLGKRHGATSGQR